MSKRFHWMWGPAKSKHDPDRNVRGKVVGMAEQMEDEAHDREASATTEAEKQFWRGYKKAAKSFRNYASDAFEIAAKLPHYD